MAEKNLNLLIPSSSYETNKKKHDEVTALLSIDIFYLHILNNLVHTKRYGPIRWQNFSSCGEF